MEPRTPSALGLLRGGALVAFVLLAVAVASGATLPLDIRLELAVHERVNHALDALMLGLTTLGNEPLLGGLVLASSGLLIRLQRRWEALALLVVMGVEGALDGALKLALHRPRPLLFPRPAAAGFSFPSGHAMATLCLIATLLCFLWPHLPPRARWPIAAGGCILTFGVGISRVYLGVHYPTDVVGGWLASTTWLAVAASLLPKAAGRLRGTAIPPSTRVSARNIPT